MKTTKQRLLNFAITMSVAVNLVMLGGLGYIATIDHHIYHIYSAMNSPMVIYVHKAATNSGDAAPITTPTQ